MADTVFASPILQASIALIVAALLYRWLSKPAQLSFLPVWVPLEVGLTRLIVSQNGVGKAILHHQILTNLSTADRAMINPRRVLSVEPMQYTLCVRVFGLQHSKEVQEKFGASKRDLTRPVEELFLNDAASTAAMEKARVPEQAASFVTFTEEKRKMQPWERSARIKVIVPDSPERAGVVEADLQSLTRDFGACIAIPLLYGQDFLNRHGDLLEDFWKFDNNIFALLTIGVPSWLPIKLMREGVAARSRLIDRLTNLYCCIDQYQRGVPVDGGADLSDVSTVALARSKAYVKHGWTSEERGVSDLSLLWGQNANTQVVFFWLVAYIYSTDGLRDRLREEVAPHVQLSSEEPLRIESLNMAGLSSECPLLKACLYETYRMANEPTSLRYVAQTVDLTDGDQQYQLREGTFVSAPLSIISRDANHFPCPNEFLPERFLEVDPETGKKTPAYGKLRPWGIGPGMCKGRTFAEKEILVLTATVLSLWEIEDASGEWKVPDIIPGNGVAKPVHDIRVRISRRVRSKV